MSNEKNQLVKFEEVTALTGRKAIEFFSEKSNLDAVIKQVQDEALTLVPNVSTKKGRDEIGSTALKVSKSRKAIVEAIDKSVADLKAKVAATNEVKKHVIEQLDKTRKQVLEPRDIWQAEEDAKEQKRIDDIKQRISNIANIGTHSASETKEQLSEKIDTLEAIDVSDGFEEFAQDAAREISVMTKRLNERILQLVEQERQAETQRQLDAERMKNEVQTKIVNISQMPLKFMGKTADEIQMGIDNLSACSIDKAVFGERTNEAKQACEMAVQQLQMMLEQAQKLEAMERQSEPQKSFVSEPEPELVLSHDDKMVSSEPAPEQAPQAESELTVHEKLGVLMYALTKHAARQSFSDFLADCELSDDDYSAIKYYLNARLGPVSTYV